MVTYILKHRKQVLKRNQQLVMKNLAIYRQWIDDEPRASVVMPQAVSTSFPKLDVPDEIEDFCLRLLKETGVLLVPGNRFDMLGHVRLGYCADEATLRTGLKRLSKFLRQYD